MSEISIKVENLSKLYQLGQIGTGTLHRDLKRWWHRVRGLEDPFQKIGRINDRTQKIDSDLVWALQNINFTVNKGEVLGIIGKNGAGKSTLLKILSKITSATTGNIYINGRIASLLEVGTGFHPELTGRDNIFMNGAILGMRKSEIKRKFDEIVDFAGVEAYIDTPVKRYSSGMYVRLAFSVAAFLEPEILIVDEVLAVGDAEFQKKCLGRMKDVSANDGRTVLFVSHNMGSVKELCNRSLYLKNGELYKIGHTNEIVSEYLFNPESLNNDIELHKTLNSRSGNGEARFVSVRINNNISLIDPQNKIILDFSVKIFKKINKLNFALLLKSPDTSELISTTRDIEISSQTLDVGTIISFTFTIEKNILRSGLFPLYIWLGRNDDDASPGYNYDILDSVYYLNLFSEKNTIDLGYNSANPRGYFNFNYEISNLTIN